jgi:precorrin-6B methylase 2
MRLRDLSLPVLLGVAIVGASSCAAKTEKPAPAPTPPPSTAPAPEAPRPPGLRDPDVIYVPTPQEVVDAMLKLAEVKSTDTVYDLGSGDGRIPITAAQKYGARGVGIDINPERIREANENLAKAMVSDKVRFMNADLFETDLSPATVITLYLLPSLNLKLLPKLKALKPGTRIVSHSFDMGTEWTPEKTEDVQGRTIYRWTVK